jgi:uncharacterized membrane protein
MFNWVTFITEVFKDVVDKYGVSLGDLSNRKVVVRDMNYFRDMGTILTEALAADAKILGQLLVSTFLYSFISSIVKFEWIKIIRNLSFKEHYLKWRVMLSYGNDISQKLRDVFFEFSKKTSGTVYPNPRYGQWKSC